METDEADYFTIAFLVCLRALYAGKQGTEKSGFRIQ